MTPTMLFAALALSVGAPKLKDPPKTPPPLAGKWQVVEWIQGGSEMAFSENTVHEYTADGKRIIHTGDSAEEGRRYELMAKADPPAVDLYRTLDGTTEHFRAIYKVEKDQYVLCIGKPGGDRPTVFSSTAENGCILMTFKKVEKK